MKKIQLVRIVTGMLIAGSLAPVPECPRGTSRAAGGAHGDLCGIGQWQRLP